MTPDVEKFIFAFAQKMWAVTYKVSDDDLSAVRIISKNLDRIGRLEGAFDDVEFARIAATTKWIHCGAPRLVTDEKYAAALMCSRVSEGLSEDIILPWKSFRVEIPPGLLSFGDFEYRYALIATFDEAENETASAFLLLEGTREAPDETKLSCLVKGARSVADLLFDLEIEGFDMASDTCQVAADEKARTLRLAVRLVVGLLYTMQYTNNFRPSPPSLNDPRRSLREGPPKHRTIFVGKPMKMNAVSAVRAFCGGGAKLPPSVQSLVRGHFKRQVVGVGRGGRKVIWVEPYWRGPEDAPILSRPYKVGANA